MVHTSDDIDYCNERLGALDRRLQKWNNTQQEVLIAHQKEIVHSYPEFSALRRPIDKLGGRMLKNERQVVLGHLTI
jgi:hypothetical protein